MDIEKLIRRLRNDADAYRNGKTLGRAFADQEDVLDNAATAISTLQAENEKLRAELEQVKRMQLLNLGVASVRSAHGAESNIFQMGRWTIGAKLAAITINVTGNGAARRRGEHGTADIL